MTTTSAVTGASAAAATSALSGSNAAATQDRFLKILVSQMQYQDPMNPMDNAQITSQMAQISTVDGITQLNQTLQSLAGQFGALQAMQAANLVGRTVTVSGNALALSGGAATGAFSLASAADQVTVSVSDASGKVVHRASLGALAAGSSGFQWNGKDDAGNALPDGSYTFSVAATKNGAAVAATTQSVATVLGLSRDAGSVSLDLGALGAHSFSDIQSIQ